MSSIQGCKTLDLAYADRADKDVCLSIFQGRDKIDLINPFMSAQGRNALDPL
ncbi:MAG: hypothetical protein KA885_01125 [Spirochaetes bacterium]|nr:hypothetical protein [Spirochaetota bacterium]